MSVSGDREPGPLAVEGEAADAIEEQRDLMAAVQTLLRNFKKDAIARKTEAYHVTRLEALERYRDEFRQNHRVLIRLAKNAQIKKLYIETAFREQFEDLYLEVAVLIKESLKVNCANPPESSKTSTPSGEVRPMNVNNGVPLPEVKLPTFDGNYVEWPSFEEIFVDRVHSNNNLNDLQRFHYLKTALIGNAAQDIQHISLVGDNYREAWDLLGKQYNNKRVLFTHYMDVLSQQAEIIANDPASIKHFAQTCRSCCSSIKKLGIQIDEQSHILLYYLLKKVPSKLRFEWDRNLRKQDTIPILNELCSFLDEQYLMLVTSSNATEKQQQLSSYSRRKGEDVAAYQKGKVKSMYLAKKTTTCPICNRADHPVRECSTFNNLSVAEKRLAVTQHKLCFNCLGYNHQATNCSSKRTCGKCGGKHHTSIHMERETIISPPLMQNHSKALHIATNKRGNDCASRVASEVLLPTAVITLKSNNGERICFRALLDQGSQATFLSERAAQVLGLPRTRVSINITGLSDTAVTTGRFCVDLCIGSRLDSDVKYQTVAYILPKVCGTLPTAKIGTSKYHHIVGLPLADPKFFDPRSIDVILGSDVYDECVQDEVRRAGKGLPIAQKTTFGYIISGKSNQTVTSSKGYMYQVRVNSNDAVETLLKKFWELESIGDKLNIAEQENWSESFYRDTHKRLQDGRYVVRLPLKTEIDESFGIGFSRTAAMKRFIQLENRLQRDIELRNTYTETINEYLKLGQMKPVQTKEKDHRVFDANNNFRLTCCYLPHHPVVKQDAVSTKVRIVFDASSKTSNGKSLNDILFTGPALQPDLSAVLTNWRTFKYVFMADIEKMFRRIDMDEQDAQYQRILWREDPGQPIQEYYCKTVMFGTASAPYTAIRTVHQLASDEEERFPLAASVIRQQMYVDDILSGGNTIEEAIKVRQEINSMLNSASFELRKWASNQPALVNGIPIEHRHAKDTWEFKTADSIKALGMCWDPRSDEFQFEINFKMNHENPTKRSVLSSIARLFDPLGWLSPVILSAKLIMQQLWLLKVGWDVPLTGNIGRQWQKFMEELYYITQLRIPRWLEANNNKGNCELHIFCDASLHAHSAAAYLRGTNKNGHYITQLLLAKSKVNPAKPKLTIPRAELCGAVLASKVLKFIKENIQIEFDHSRIFMWTDSSIVLHWIRGEPSRWKVFVANRIRKILDISTADQWRHITSSYNPADVSSRGCTPLSLYNNDLWWSGPAFLQLPFHDWPKSELNNINVCPSIENEQRNIKALFTVRDKLQESNLLDRWSSFSSLVRIVAYCLRFANNCRVKQGTAQSGFLSALELRTSVICVVRMVQRETFSEDYTALSTNKPLPRHSTLHSLNPYFDSTERVMRLGGRLENAHLSVDQKHPFILPMKHHVSTLIVNHSHLNTLHGGISLTLNHIRQRFWMVNARTLVRSVIHRCIICFKQNPKFGHQQMGNLPAERVTPARAFSSTGVDYAGPFNILPSKGRGRTSIKGYIALFICLATKAIHLELVGDLTTDAFIGALNRFVARRGLCGHIYSDRGTNFVGADHKLRVDRDIYKGYVNQSIGPYLASKGIQWHFIPPSSPHFGGLWEAGVKSVKYHLKRTVGEQRLTYEEFYTILTQIEACLNSRPLCPLNSDINELMVLTPGHFLIGDSLLAPPTIATNSLSLAERWKHGQNLVQQFWRKWSKEYLARLQHRPKWLKRQSNFKINELVLVKDERLPCNRWPLARIVELHPGKDGLVRVVTLRTANGIMQRPIVKICSLPLTDNWVNSITDQAQ